MRCYVFLGFIFLGGGGILFSPSIFILYYLELGVGLLFARPLLADFMSIVIIYIAHRSMGNIKHKIGLYGYK